MPTPDEWNAPPTWTDNKVPDQFKYPWGYVWRTIDSSLGSFKPTRQRSRAPYSRRCLTSFQLRMLNRITSNKKPEPPHPDQLFLF